MKLKAMYTCITKTVDSDEAYETADSKKAQTKKLCKSSKKSSTRAKKQQLSNGHVTPVNGLPTTPKKNEITSSGAPPKSSMTFAGRLLDGKRINSNSEILVNNCCDNLPTPRKFSTEFSFSIHPTSNSSLCFESTIGDVGLPSPETGGEESVKTLNSSLCETDRKSSEKSLLCLNSDTSDYLNSSHDDVFAGSGSNWLTGDDEWNDVSSCDEGEDRTVKLIKNFKLNPTTPPPSNQTSKQLFDNVNLKDRSNTTSLNNSQTKKPISRVSSSSPRSSPTPTSVDRATDSFDAVRDLCARERMSRGYSFQHRSKSMASVLLTPRRAFSASPTTREIPPLIPPREPLRSARFVPPQRHASSPSHSSLTGNSSPSSIRPKPRLSARTQHETSRSTHQSQSSTTLVFSAVPPSLSKSSPVILPIMKNGVQESHTHYYLLGSENETNQQQKKPQKPRQHEPIIGIPRPTPKAIDRCEGALPPPRPPPPPKSVYASSGSLKLDNVERSCSLPLASEMSSDWTSNRSPRNPSPTGSPSERHREKAQTVPRCTALSPGQMVRALQSKVFGVTAEECQTALRQNDWSISRSANYLKIEQLFRVGLTTRKNCQELLRITEWDLHSASQLLLEQHQQGQKTRC